MPSPSEPIKHSSAGFFFGPDRRILKRADFKRAYAGGRRASGRLATVFCMPRPDEEKDGPPRLGITATLKTGNAVRRNRQKRLVRSFFRLSQRELPEGHDFVVNTRAAMARVSYAELATDLARTLTRLGIDMSATPQ